MNIIKRYLLGSTQQKNKKSGLQRPSSNSIAEIEYVKQAVIAYAHMNQINKQQFYLTLSRQQKSGVIFKAERVSRLVKLRSHTQNIFTPIVFLWQHYLKNTLIVVLSFCLVFAGFFLLSEQIFKGLPKPELLKNQQPNISSQILDRNGQLLYKIYENENRTIIPLSEIPRSLIDATVAIEDQDFWQHWGFSLKGITRAFFENRLTDTISQGGSTITQQLVKNRLLSKERTFKRKIKELILAILVETQYSKEEILEMYLNQVSYGGAAYGVEAAAQQYFGKSAKDLSLAESALLAGLPAAPSVFSPFGPSPELAFTRQKEVLRRMSEDGYITQKQAEKTAQEQISFRQDKIEITAPHFVMYVKQILAEKYGEELLLQGGLQIKTTLDSTLQKQTEKIVADEISQLKKLKISNGASLVINPKTGEILSMVGSSNYFDFANDGQVNITLRPRQPGSSIKPITYALAFSLGKNPSDFIIDSPITFRVTGSQPYNPRNYDGKFHGKVTLREALASSYNVPAVKLLSELGVEKLIDFAQKLGISTWTDRKRFGLSLTLGGGEVTMIDLASAYSTFANGGLKIEPTAILEITLPNGQTLYRNDCVLDKTNCPNKQVLDPQVAYQITHILKDDKARAPAFGLMSTLSIKNQEVAVKTGTTNNLRDNWTIGYTSDRLVATWVGNNDNTPMSYVASGITGASPIWNKIIRLNLDEKNPHRFAIPSGVVITNICATTGTLPCKGCPSVREEVYQLNKAPTKACYFAMDKKEPKTN